MDTASIFINDFMPTGLIITGASPLYDTHVTTGMVYGETGDSCHDQFFDETGIYYNALDTHFLNQFGT